MLQAFAYWEKTPVCEYRWGTLLVSNGDERIVGNAVLKNPGSSRPLETISSREDGRLRFTVDLSMVALAELFGINNSGGTVRIFNLSSIREADFSKAKQLIASLDAKDEDVAYEILHGPAVQTYLGWGELYKDPRLRAKAEDIFEVAKQHTPSLLPNIDDNLFFHPLYLMNYGRNKEACKEIVKNFRNAGSIVAAPPELHLISVSQCAKLLDFNKDFVKRLLEKKELDYVRDSCRVFRISLDSVLEYAGYHKFQIDNDYLDALRKKIHPWREDQTDIITSELQPKVPQPSEPTIPIRRKYSGSPFPDEMLDMRFCRRAYSAFAKNDIFTLERLTSLSASDLMKMENFGRKALNNVRTILAEHGLSLKASKEQ